MIGSRELLKGIVDPDEKLVFAKALDKYALTERIGKETFTAFMDPYKANRLKQLTDSLGSTIACRLFGGYADAERLKVGFLGYEYECDFPIVCVKVSYNEQFSRRLSHRDFLGSLMGLGIVRDKIGDIILDSGFAAVYVDEDIADYICTSLDRVGHTKVSTEIATDFKPRVAESTERRLTVASLRLDAVLGGAFNISRGKVADLIRAEKAFVNWQCVTNGSKLVGDGDMLTLRGCGRVRLNEVVGTTKKDRVLIAVTINK
jgi:RNA-binding protein YlmH